MSTAWSLSPELHVCIISALFDDPRSLKVCSLVSRSWYHTAIRTFWSDRALRVHAGRLTDLNRVERLQTLLEDVSCHFAPHIKVINLDGLYIWTLTPQQRATAYNTISRIVELLSRASPDLKQLSIKYLQFDQLSDEAQQKLSSLKDLTSLALFGTSFPDPISMITWISNFSKLRMLQVNISVPKVPLAEIVPKNVESVNRIDLQSLKELDFHMQPGFDIVIQQILARPTNFLHSLRVTWPNPFGFNLVAQLLDHVGPGLKSLALDIGDAVLFATGESPDFQLNLKRNVVLTYLEVGSICIREEEPFPSDWLRGFLQSINSPSIDKICIDFTPAHTDEEDVQEYFFHNFEWSTLDEVLPSNKHFDGWGKVEIYIGCADYHLNNEDKVEAEFMSHLPNLEASTKLVLHF